MERVEQQLQHLPRGRGLRPLPQAVAQGDERSLHAAPEPLDLVPQLQKRGPHPHDGGVHVDELGAEVDEIVVVAVDEVDELVVEGGEVAPELGPEGVEGDEGAELGDVGLGVEVPGEEGGGLEPERVGVLRVREQIRGRSRRRRRGRRRRRRDGFHHIGAGFLPVLNRSNLGRKIGRAHV